MAIAGRWIVSGVFFCCASLSGCDEFPGSEKSNAHDAVKLQLVDGDSAKFRDDTVAQGGAVCGFVNAKNRMGGYVGFTPYVYTGDIAGKPGLVFVSPGDPEFGDYFKYRDNEFIVKGAIEKISNVCSFASSWKIWCAAVERPEISGLIDDCALWTGGQKGMDKLAEKYGG